MRRSENDFRSGEPYLVVERHEGNIGGFLLGLAVGAGIALLFAPQSGEATRRDLKRRARKASELARDAAGDLSDSVVDHYEQARRSVEEGIDSARRTVTMRRHQAAEAVRAGREAAHQARQDLEARVTETKAAYRTATRPHPGPGESDADLAGEGSGERAGE